MSNITCSNEDCGNDVEYALCSECENKCPDASPALLAVFDEMRAALALVTTCFPDSEMADLLARAAAMRGGK